jgi:hypothetical protein
MASRSAAVLASPSGVGLSEKFPLSSSRNGTDGNLVLI